MTRPIFLAFLSLFLFTANADDSKSIDSEISKVTVFLNGAQVTRDFNVSLKIGTSTIKVGGLTPYLDAKTLQLKGDGDFTILSIRHQMNYIDEKEVEGDLKVISDSMNFYQKAYKLVEIELNSLSHSEAFLQNNRSVKGNNDNLDATTLKGVHQYYYTELLSINRKRNDLNYQKAGISAAMSRFRRQLNALNSKLTKNTSEVLVELQADKVTVGKFQLSYLVNHASWYPSYDIRVGTINDPLKLVYKANVQQNTGEDWDNVKLTFSNANPYQSGDLPILKPYYLNFISGGYNPNPYKANATQNSYNLNNYISSNISQASGRVVDQNSQPIPYATIKVQGTSVGTVTDESGNFSISLPQGKNQLFVSNVGFSDKWQAVGASSGNVIVLNSSQVTAGIIGIDEDGDGVGDYYDDNLTSISEESISLNSPRQVAATQSYRRLSFTAPKKASYESKAITVMPMENQTSLELSLEIPFTIKSTGKQKVVSINEVDVPAYYEYRTVPKLEKAAFLIARVANWGEYNLLEGEANLYFENTYIGKSILDVRFLTDTLNISLGRDKNVLVSRQKVKSQTSRELIGKDNIEKRQFEIKVRNNKSQSINLIVYDQVPLSQHPKDIEVDLKEKSGANHDARTGELKWEVKIDANQTKELSMKYQVKFPQNQQINIE